MPARQPVVENVIAVRPAARAEIAGYLIIDAAFVGRDGANALHNRTRWIHPLRRTVNLGAAVILGQTFQRIISSFATYRRKRILHIAFKRRVADHRQNVTAANIHNDHGRPFGGLTPRAAMGKVGFLQQAGYVFLQIGVNRQPDAFRNL